MRARVMPCLLLRHGSLVKTVCFKDASYVGDPVNAIHIFNAKEVDELILLDIAATAEGAEPPYDVIARIASECFMPAAYGGGLRNVEQVQRILALGIEKVVINTAAVEDPALVPAIARRFGNQCVVVSIDAKRSISGEYEVFTRGGTRPTGLRPDRHAAAMTDAGAGEILITSIDRDGTMQGYDVDLIRSVSEAVSVPVIASGGAGKVSDFAMAVNEGGAAAAAAGAMVVYFGRNRAVLINFPDRSDIERALA